MLNRDRQAVEQRILREAIAHVDEWPEERRRRRAYVIADEDWHEGVIGIVASRLVERFHRSFCSLEETANGRGLGGRSPRSTFTAVLPRARTCSSAGAATGRLRA